MEIFDKFTGKTIESKLDEYSTVYGEVLLGVHREVQAQEVQVQELEDLLRGLRHRVDELESKQSAAEDSVESDVQRLRRDLKRWRWVSFGAVLIALLAFALGS